MKDNLFLERMNNALSNNALIGEFWDGYNANPFAVRVNIPYSTKIGQEKVAMNEIYSCLNSINQYTLIAADTGSGKTWATAHAFKMCDPKKVLNVYLLPSKVQTREFSKKYEIRGLTAGDMLSKDNLESGNIALVYDKLRDFREYLEEDDEVLKGKIINVIVDEAHLLYQAKTYRTKCINMILDTIEEIKSRDYFWNVVLISASFETLMPIAFDKIITFYSTQERKVPNTGIIVNQRKENEETFIAREIAKQLKHGKKVYCRLNNKKLSRKIALALKEQGLGDKFYFLNADEKEEKNGIFDNFVLEKLLNGRNKKDENLVEVNKNIKDNVFGVDIDNNFQYKTGILPEFDVIFLTNMLDAGFSIEGVEGVNEEDIVPMFIVNRSLNIDNIEQSFARLRFPYNERYVVICNPVWDQEPLILSEIIKEEYRKVANLVYGYKSLYNSLLESTDPEFANKTIKNHFSFINSDGSASASCLSLKEVDGKYEIEYDEFLFYRFCREEKWMKQFLNRELLQKELLRILGGAVYFYENKAEVDIEIKKENDETRNQRFAALSEEDRNEFDLGKGDVFDYYKDSVVIEHYKTIRMRYSINETFEFLKTYTMKELCELSKNVCKQEIEEFEDKDKKDFMKLAKGEVVENYSKKVAIIKQNEVFKQLKTMLEIGIENRKAFETIVKNEDTIKETILMHQAKIVRNEFRKKLPASGQFEKEQYVIMNTIEQYKGTNKFLNIKKDSPIMNNIIFGIQIEIDKKTSANYIIQSIQRLYRTTQLKEGKKVVGVTVAEMLK